VLSITYGADGGEIVCKIVCVLIFFTVYGFDTFDTARRLNLVIYLFREKQFLFYFTFP